MVDVVFTTGHSGGRQRTRVLLLSSRSLSALHFLHRSRCRPSLSAPSRERSLSISNLQTLFLADTLFHSTMNCESGEVTLREICCTSTNLLNFQSRGVLWVQQVIKKQSLFHVCQFDKDWKEKHDLYLRLMKELPNKSNHPHEGKS